jgi:hypothetical protein
VVVVRGMMLLAGDDDIICRGLSLWSGAATMGKNRREDLLYINVDMVWA